MIVAALALLVGFALGLVAARAAALRYRRRWREALALAERMDDRLTNPLPVLPVPKLKARDMERLRREVRKAYGR